MILDDNQKWEAKIFSKQSSNNASVRSNSPDGEIRNEDIAQKKSILSQRKIPLKLKISN